MPEEAGTAYSTLHWRLRTYRGPARRAKMSRQRRGAVAEGPMPAEQRDKISASLKGNTNARGTGKRTGQALENIRRGQEERRRREREARAAAMPE